MAADGAARLIRSPEDAELAAAEWMRRNGWPDARCTPRGPDGGIDVVSSSAVAQVKAHMVPVGRPDLQALYGVAVSLSKQPLFFSLMDYTAQAHEWAEEVQLPLFRFDHSGAVEPVNGPARAVAAGGTGDAGSTGQRLGFPFAVDQAAAERAVSRARRGALRREQAEWVRPCWVTAQHVRLDYTTRTRRRTTEHRSATVLFELISASRILVPVPADASSLHGAAPILPPLKSLRGLQRRYDDAMKRLASVRQPDAVARHRATLAELGAPGDATSVSASLLDQLAFPVYVGMLTSSSGQRLVCVDGLSAAAMPDLSEDLTANLPWTVDLLHG